MLRAIPKSIFSWNFTVMDGPRPVAEIDVSWWREKGQLTVEGAAYEVYREGLMRGAFILEEGEAILARAEKPSAFQRLFLVEHAGRQYTLRARSAFFREVVLLDGAAEIGVLSPEGFFNRRMTVDLPEHLPLPVRVFMIWLTVILWKRDAESAPAGGGS